MHSIPPGLETRISPAALTLLSAATDAGWVVSPIIWSSLSSRTLEFTAAHETGGNTFVLCHESSLLEHLQRLLLRLG